MDQGRSAEQNGSSSPGLVAIAEILLEFNVEKSCQEMRQCADLSENQPLRATVHDLTSPSDSIFRLPAILYDFAPPCHSIRLHLSLPFYTTSLLPAILYDFTSPYHSSRLHLSLPFYSTSSFTTIP